AGTGELNRSVEEATGNDRTEARTKAREQTPYRSGATAAYCRYSGADASGGDRHRRSDFRRGGGAMLGVREGGPEAGSAAVAAVRGSIAAAREIGGDLGRLSGRVLNGTFDAAWEIGKDLMHLGAGGAKRPLAKVTSQRRSRTSERQRSTRRSA